MSFLNPTFVVLSHLLGSFFDFINFLVLVTGKALDVISIRPSPLSFLSVSFKFLLVPSVFEIGDLGD